MVVPKMRVQTQLQLTQPVTLGCSRHLFEPQFLHQQNGPKTFLHHGFFVKLHWVLCNIQALRKC